MLVTISHCVRQPLLHMTVYIYLILWLCGHCVRQPLLCVSSWFDCVATSWGNIKDVLQQIYIHTQGPTQRHVRYERCLLPLATAWGNLYCDSVCLPDFMTVWSLCEATFTVCIELIWWLCGYFVGQDLRYSACKSSVSLCYPLGETSLIIYL